MIFSLFGTLAFVVWFGGRMISSRKWAYYWFTYHVCYFLNVSLAVRLPVCGYVLTVTKNLGAHTKRKRNFAVMANLSS
jgi:hypothetical protein